MNRLLSVCCLLAACVPESSPAAVVVEPAAAPQPRLAALLVSVNWPAGVPTRSALVAADGALTLLTSSTPTTPTTHQVSWLTQRAAGTLVVAWVPPELTTRLTLDGATVTAGELLESGRGAGLLAVPITDDTCGFLTGTARLVEGQLRVKTLLRDAQGERVGLLRFAAPESSVEWMDDQGNVVQHQGDVIIDGAHFLVRTREQRVSGLLVGSGETRTVFGAVSCPKEAGVSTAAK